MLSFFHFDYTSDDKINFNNKKLSTSINTSDCSLLNNKYEKNVRPIILRVSYLWRELIILTITTSSTATTSSRKRLLDELNKLIHDEEQEPSSYETATTSQIIQHAESSSPTKKKREAMLY